MKKPDNTFDIIFNWVGTSELFKQYGMNKGNIIVFILILSLFEQNTIVSKYDVIKANRSKKMTSHANIYQLINLGLLSANKSNQFFSKSYLSLTPKGLLLKSQLKKVLNSPIAGNGPKQ
jgi:hypothetical protein